MEKRKEEEVRPDYEKNRDIYEEKARERLRRALDNFYNHGTK